MPQVFNHDEPPVRLSIAYELYPEPKPTLAIVHRWAKTEGDITIMPPDSQSPFFRVPSVDWFAEELSDAIKRRGWTGYGGTSVTYRPEGTEVITAWCREHVDGATGRQRGLFDQKHNPPKLSTRAGQSLLNGYLPTASRVGSGQAAPWVAPPADIKAWLERDFGIYAR